ETVRHHDVEGPGSELLDGRVGHRAGEEPPAVAEAPPRSPHVALARVEADVVDAGRQLGQQIGRPAADVEDTVARPGAHVVAREDPPLSGPPDGDAHETVHCRQREYAARV